MKLESFKQFKELRLNESKNEIDSICKKYGIENYTINDDLSIDVDGNVNLNDRGLKKLPLKFRNVSGIFYCSYNQLTTLEGSPKKVRSFCCDNNRLTTLEGSPRTVEGSFICYNNQLTSLEGSPQSVGEHFYCNSNQLTDLKGLPNISKDVFAKKNKLTSLEGCPEIINGNFYIFENSLNSLKGCASVIKGEFYFSKNNIKNFEGYPNKIKGQISVLKNPIMEILNFFPIINLNSSWKEVVNDLIFYEVIDGNRVYIQALLEVFDVYKLELTEDDIIRKVKSYMVI